MGPYSPQYPLIDLARWLGPWGWLRCAELLAVHEHWGKKSVWITRMLFLLPHSGVNIISGSVISLIAN
jgi:hypothetical protein